MEYRTDLESPLVEAPSNKERYSVSQLNIVLLCINVLTFVGVLIFGVHNWSNNDNTAAPTPSGSYGNAPCASICAPVCLNQVKECFPKCYQTCDEGQGTTMIRPAVLGDKIMMNAIQHVGVTTSNLSRSVQFYTEVLGGVEVVDAGGDGWKSDSAFCNMTTQPNCVYNLLMQQALLGGPATAKWAVNLSHGGPGVLNARYVSFGSLVVEFLDYKADEVKLQEQMLANPQAPTEDQLAAQPPPSPPGVFPTWSDSNVAPSVSGNMHISFNIRPSASLTEFVNTLESEAHSRGYMNVWCNRLVHADNHSSYKAIPTSQNAYFVQTGGFKGWSLAYCKGPDGEQLEFNQVVDNAKMDFDAAQATYVAGGKNALW